MTARPLLVSGALLVAGAFAAAAALVAGAVGAGASDLEVRGGVVEQRTAVVHPMSGPRDR